MRAKLAVSCSRFSRSVCKEVVTSASSLTVIIHCQMKEENPDQPYQSSVLILMSYTRTPEYL